MIDPFGFISCDALEGSSGTVLTTTAAAFHVFLDDAKEGGGFTKYGAYTTLRRR